MAWVNPSTVATGDVLTASKWNQEVRDKTTDLRSRDGLIHIRSETYGATGVTLDNIFTTDYRAYRINIYVDRAIQWVTGLLRSSAPADVTAANYDQTVIETTTTVDKSRNTANGQTSWANMFLTGDRGTFVTIDVMNPAHTAYTQLLLKSFSSENANASKANLVTGGFGFRATTAHAGIKFTSSATASGIVRVYAYGEG